MMHVLWKSVLELTTRRRLYVRALIQTGFLCLGHLITFYFRSKIIENCKRIHKFVMISSSRMCQECRANRNGVNENHLLVDCTAIYYTPCMYLLLSWLQWIMIETKICTAHVEYFHKTNKSEKQFIKTHAKLCTKQISLTAPGVWRRNIFMSRQ